MEEQDKYRAENRKVLQGDPAMTMTCNICSHPSRLQIDREIVAGRSLRAIATEYGLSSSSLARHRARHLSRQLLKSAGAKQALDAQRLLDDVEAMRSRILEILDKCRAKGWYNSELRGIAEWRNTLQFLTGLALDLHRLEIEEGRAGQRLQIEDLKEVYTRSELEQLQTLLSKRDQGAGTAIAATLQEQIPRQNLPPVSHSPEEQADQPKKQKTLPRIRRCSPEEAAGPGEAPCSSMDQRILEAIQAHRRGRAAL